MNIQRTIGNAVVIDGVEYNEQIPECILRFIHSDYAKSLVQNGELLLHSLKYHREAEQKIMRDENEGKGLVRINDKDIHLRSVREPYIYCTALKQITQDGIRMIAKRYNYDSVVIVDSPDVFIRRIKSFISDNHKKYTIHCGTVHYDRGREVSKDEELHFEYNAFQKSEEFRIEQEYRLCISDFSEEQEDTIKLTIGDCSDIMHIKSLCEFLGVPPCPI